MKITVRSNKPKGRSGSRSRVGAKNKLTTPIPASEQWLFRAPAALARVRLGLRQAAAGKTSSLGTFKQYVKDKS